VLNLEAPYRLLLADGRIAWSNKLGKPVAVDIQGKRNEIDATKQAFSVQGIIPEWKTIQSRALINIIRATERTLCSITNPPYSRWQET